MLSVDEALAAILQHVQTPASIDVLLQHCLNLVLAEDLTTPHDSPPFDKSMMDGFAVRSEGFGEYGEKELNVLETITAGTVPGKAVSADAASRIMTGACLPEGADCVVPVERVTFDETHPESVTIEAGYVAAERNVLRQGDSAKAGEHLMEKGTRLAPQHIAVLAEFGVAAVPVYRQPSVAVLATGDELLAVDQPLTPGRIRNSNEPMLVSQIRRAGAEAVPLGVAKDTRDDLRPKIERGLACDFLLLSGGVSAGTLDLVPSELEAAGVKQVFHRIKMKPGKPLWFGELQTGDRRCQVFGLPGNPVSSMICFELFVRTALRKFGGFPAAEPDYIHATLTEAIAVKGDRPTYFPSRLTQSEAGMTATPVPWGGSADLRATAAANGMCLLQPCENGYQAGSQVPSLKW